MITHEVEVRCKETSDVIRVSSISDAAIVGFILDDVVVGRGISRVGGWFGITLTIEYTYAGTTSVGGVGVPFDVEAMRGIA